MGSRAPRPRCAPRAWARAGFPDPLAGFGFVSAPHPPAGCSGPVHLRPLFAGAPGPPGVPIIVRYSSAIAIHWSSGDPGKGPVTRYVIEARPSGTPGPEPARPAEQASVLASLSPSSLSPPTWRTSVRGHPRRRLCHARQSERWPG